MLELEQYAVRTSEGFTTSPLSFALEAGGSVVVAGQRASGKSILFERLAGIRRPGIQRLGTAKGLRPALVPQDARLAALPTDTAWSVLGLSRSRLALRRVIGFEWARTPEEQTVEETLSRLGIDLRRIFDLPFSALSGGERRCVILAAALRASPATLLIDAWDEIADRAQRRRIRAELTRHQARGMALMIASRRFPALEFEEEDAVELNLPQGSEPAVPLLPKQDSFAPHDRALLSVERLSVARRQIRLGRSSPTSWIVDGASLYIRHGECLALFGPPDAGKTTLLHTIAGLTPPVAGVLTLEGRDVTYAQGARGRRLRRDVQLVFQNAAAVLDDHRTVLSHMREASGLRNRDSDASRWLELVGIPSRLATVPAGQLSSGDAQRLDLARSLVVEPKLILWDTPEAAAAALDGGALAATLIRQKRQGQSFLLATADLELASLFADRVAVMYAGRVVELGAKGSVFGAPAHPVTRALIDGRPLSTSNPSAPARGCPHVKDCPRRQVPQCDEKEPMLAPLESILHPGTEAAPGGRRVACFFPITPEAKLQETEAPPPPD